MRPARRSSFRTTYHVRNQPPDHAAARVVVGICNGFQILCEAGLLPGALLRNANLTFVCSYVQVRVEHADSIFTSSSRAGDVLQIPIAHGEGNYFVDDAGYDLLESRRQILFRYCEPDGSITPGANPNGSVRGIAGIRNEGGNVMGMMPHPERASDPVLGHCDGQAIFQSIIQSVSRGEVMAAQLSFERS